MTTATTSELEHFLRDSIPLARAMELRVGAHHGEALTLHAPLAANANDKGCAFGGSLSGLMTLAGWGVVELSLRQRGLRAEVFVADARVRYLRPLFADIEARATLADGESLAAFHETLAANGKAELRIVAEVAGSDGPACTQQARYVARLSHPDS